MKKLFRSLALLSTLAFTSCATAPLSAAEQFYHDRLLVSEVVSVYDGDSVKVNFDYLPAVIGQEIYIRIWGIDTPELRSAECPEEKELGIKARDYVATYLSTAKTVEVRNVTRDKYFRLLGEIWVDSISVGKLLIDQGLAYEYYGGAKQSWCPEETVGTGVQ